MFTQVRAIPRGRQPWYNGLSVCPHAPELRMVIKAQRKPVGKPSHHRDGEKRHKQIMELIAAGLSERQIARALGISKTTVHHWASKERVA